MRLRDPHHRSFSTCNRSISVDNDREEHRPLSAGITIMTHVRTISVLGCLLISFGFVMGQPGPDKKPAPQPETTGPVDKKGPEKKKDDGKKIDDKKPNVKKPDD